MVGLMPRVFDFQIGNWQSAIGNDQNPFPAMYLMRSRTRQEYPHSLSYHESILIMWPPITLVYSASIIDDLELPLSLDEISGASENARLPFNFYVAASYSARFYSLLL